MYKKILMNELKKWMLIAAILGFCRPGHTALVNALDDFDKPGKKIDNYSSEAVYISSNSCAATVGTVLISTSPSLIFAIDITSAGVGSPAIELFNSSISTKIANTRITGPLRADISSALNEHYLEIYASSGIAIYNYTVPDGGTPACWTLYYQDRK